MGGGMKRKRPSDEIVLKNLKEIMRSKGITQTDLADMLNTSPQNVCQYFRGRRSISNILDVISEKINVPIWEMYATSSEKSFKTQEEVDMLEKLKSEGITDANVLSFVLKDLDRVKEAVGDKVLLDLIKYLSKKYKH